MKRTTLLFAIIFLLPVFSWAGGTTSLFLNMPQQGTAVTTSCIGYPDHGTNCDYTTAPEGQASIAADATRARIWTASVNGTVSRVKVYFISCGTGNTFTIGYWNGTELRGTATITCSANAWVWSGDFAAYSGRSLSFSSSDSIYFGVSVDYGSGTTGIGRDNETTNYSYYSEAAYLPDPHSLTSNANYEMALILEYDH